MFKCPRRLCSTSGERGLIAGRAGCYSLLIGALLLNCTSIVNAGAENWPRFRGNNGTGLSTESTVPVTWGTEDVNWKVKLPGTGHCSPVLWGRHVLLSCASVKTAQRTVLCLNTADGAEIWRRDFASRAFRQHRSNSFASSTPAVDDAGIYITWTTPSEVTLLALDHKGGKKWRRNLGPFKSMHGSGTSPIVCGELVVLANDQQGRAFLIAVDRHTGQTRWRIKRNSGLTPASTPCIFRPEGGRPELIFTSTAHGITSVDPNSGTVNWQVEGVFEDRCVGSPVVGNGLIFGAYGYGARGTRFVAVRPGSEDTEPEIAYDITESVPLVPTPIVKDNHLFLWADDGRVTCVNATTGETIWRHRVDGSFYGSPICAGARLYCISRKGEVVVLAASDEFRELGHTALGELCYSTPAVGNGTIYIRTYSHLLSVGARRQVRKLESPDVFRGQVEPGNCSAPLPTSRLTLPSSNRPQPTALQQVAQLTCPSGSGALLCPL